MQKRFIQAPKKSKHTTEEKAYYDACRELDIKAFKSMDVIYFGTIIVLNRVYGWKKLRIERFMDICSEVFQECGANDISMIQKCDEETGIELRNTDNVPYKECPYLFTEKWNEIKHDVSKRGDKYWIMWQTQMKRKMSTWMYAQIEASILISLKRKEKWGTDRLIQFVNHLEEVRQEFNNEPVTMGTAVTELTGMHFTHTKEGELALIRES